MKGHGFTLIELVVLLIVMSIMVSIATARLPSVAFYRSYNVAETLIAGLTLTKILSMSQNQRYRTVIGVNSYQILNQNGVAIMHPGANTTTINYSAGVTATPSTVVFDSLGQPYDASGAPLTSTLTLTVSSSNETKTIQISPQTGFIQ